MFIRTIATDDTFVAKIDVVYKKTTTLSILSRDLILVLIIVRVSVLSIFVLRYLIDK